MKCDWGSVTGLRRETSELVLATDAGPFVLSVGPGVKVAGPDGKPLGSVMDLRAGQKVRAYYVVDQKARRRGRSTCFPGASTGPRPIAPPARSTEPRGRPSLPRCRAPLARPQDQGGQGRRRTGAGWPQTMRERRGSRRSHPSRRGADGQARAGRHPAAARPRGPERVRGRSAPRPPPRAPAVRQARGAPRRRRAPQARRTPRPVASVVASPRAPRGLAAHVSSRAARAGARRSSFYPSRKSSMSRIMARGTLQPIQQTTYDRRSAARSRARRGRTAGRLSKNKLSAVELLLARRERVVRGPLTSSAVTISHIVLALQA